MYNALFFKHIFLIGIEMNNYVNHLDYLMVMNGSNLSLDEMVYNSLGANTCPLPQPNFHAKKIIEFLDVLNDRKLVY